MVNCSRGNEAKMYWLYMYQLRCLNGINKKIYFNLKQETVRSCNENFKGGKALGTIWFRSLQYHQGLALFCCDFLGSALLTGFVYRLKANIAIASRRFSSTYDNITENGPLFKILSSKQESWDFLIRPV